jgi:photosystem II stability/assembly factor-like uncharacterized protein
MMRGFSALAVLAMAVLFAAAAGRSTPQGLRVLPVDAGTVSAFAFDARDPNIVYVGTIPGANEGRVYKSIDGGEHWRLVSGRGWTWLGALAADPRHRGTLYAGTGNAVYKTTDGGRTWAAFDRGLLPPPGINRGEGWVDWLAVDPTHSNVLYEHDYSNTIRKSHDGGQTWEPVLSLWEKGVISGLVLDASRPPTLHAVFEKWGPGGAKPWRFGYVLTVHDTTDGKTWRRNGLWLSDSAKNFPAVASAADAQRHTIYLAARARIYRSTNNGRSWSFIGQGLPEDAVINGLATGAGVVIAAFGEKGIYTTSDEGRTWTQSWPASGSAPGLGAGLVAVDPARPTTIYASADYPDNRPTATHLLRSTDSGRTWTVVG